ncbi:MAG: formate dehydrogenase [Firmicutes bacterium]|nr:formate dehydrogenase [Bacillota bacterium]
MTHNTRTKTEPPRVERFSFWARFAHWGHTISFVILLITGLMLFSNTIFGWIGPAFLGANNAGTVHRIFAVVFALVPLIALIKNPKGFIGWWKDVFSFGINDIKFLMVFPLEFFGFPVKIPPQTQFNGGEKMNSVVTTGSCVLLGITGVIMWIPEYFPVGLVQWMPMLHDVGMILATTMVCMHSYLGSFHPGSGESFWGMWKGTVRKDWAAHHHAKWLEKITGEENSH